MSFEQRLENARRVKNESLYGRSSGDDVSYFLKKQLQSDLVREKSRKAQREEKKQQEKDRAVLGYSAWKEEQERRLREKEKEDRPERDVRSEQQRREDEREWRRQDRAHLRARDAERLVHDEQQPVRKSTALETRRRTPVASVKSIGSVAMHRESNCSAHESVCVRSESSARSSRQSRKAYERVESSWQRSDRRLLLVNGRAYLSVVSAIRRVA